MAHMLILGFDDHYFPHASFDFVGPRDEILNKMADNINKYTCELRNRNPRLIYASLLRKVADTDGVGATELWWWFPESTHVLVNFAKMDERKEENENER